MEVLRPESGETPSRKRATVTTLPAEVVQRSSMHLCWVGMVTATTVVVMRIVITVLRPDVAALHRNWFGMGNAAALLVMSLALVLVGRSGFVPAATQIWIGAFYQVAAAFCLATFEHVPPWTGSGEIRGVSMLTAWIAVCGLLIPQPPRRSLLTGLAAASMGPAAYLVTQALFPNPPVPWNVLAVWFFLPFVVAIWTMIIGRRLYRLEVDVSRAREMGSYELERLLGKGGMGEVWLARHRMLACSAAVKLIRPEVLVVQPERQASIIRKRFEKEARSTAGLRSAHTVRLYDFGVAQDGSFYYAMELLDGINLEQLVKRFGPVPPGRVAKFLREACDSLGEAHQRGLVHRDIKPTNLFVCRLGLTVDVVKVVDFGLVKSMLQDGETRMTMDGMTTGTPAYMAPEVAMGSHEVDGRTDIYGLGCVAYWLLTGHLLFEERGAMAMALAHVQQTPVPPSQRTELPVPAGLERVIMACLEKDPAHRPQSAIELAHMLDRLSDVPAWTNADAEHWWQVNLPCCAFELNQEPEDRAALREAPTLT